MLTAAKTAAPMRILYLCITERGSGLLKNVWLNFFEYLSSFQDFACLVFFRLEGLYPHYLGVIPELSELFRERHFACPLVISQSNCQRLVLSDYFPAAHFPVSKHCLIHKIQFFYCFKPFFFIVQGLFSLYFQSV